MRRIALVLGPLVLALLVLAMVNIAYQPQKPNPGRWRIEFRDKFQADTFLLDTATGRVWTQRGIRWYETNVENREAAPKPWEAFATPKPNPSASSGTEVNDDGSPASPVR